MKNPESAEKMGEAGRERVKQNFSFETFATTLNGIVQSIVA